MDKQVFLQYWTILCERFNRQFSQPTIVLYYEAISAKLSSEEFTAAAKAAFAEDTHQFPTPQHLIELGVNSRPRKYFQALPEPEPTPEEEAIRAAGLKRIREMLEQNRLRSGGNHAS